MKILIAVDLDVKPEELKAQADWLCENIQEVFSNLVQEVIWTSELDKAVVLLSDVKSTKES